MPARTPVKVSSMPTSMCWPGVNWRGHLDDMVNRRQTGHNAAP
jgi:hypothetical protein